MVSIKDIVAIIFILIILLGMLLLLTGCRASAVSINIPQLKLPDGEKRPVTLDNIGQIKDIALNYRKGHDIWFIVKVIYYMFMTWLRDLIIVTLLIMILTYIGGKIPIYGIFLPKLLLSVVLGFMISLFYIFILKADTLYGLGLAFICVVIATKLWDWVFRGKLKETAKNLVKFKKISLKQ